jgi:hypothetical protein
MYSPKIREDLIPHIHRAAKAAKLPMTRWVNQKLEQALPTQEGRAIEANSNPSILREGQTTKEGVSI